MIGARAATAADDPGAGIESDAGIVSHQFRRAGIVDVAIVILRNAAIALDDDVGVRARLECAGVGLAVAIGIQIFKISR